MSLRINTNVTSLSTYSNLSSTSTKMEKSIEKLSSGLRINSASDDAAGLAISEKMRSQISGLNRAKLNAQDGMSMVQTAEGGLNETESIIQRMRELAVQASNDTLTSNDRLEIQKEINQLSDAIDDIADSTEYNTKKLLNGSQTAQISSSSSYVNGMVTGNASSGGDYSVDMEVIQGGISMVQKSQMFMDKDTGDLADGNTKLEDIAQFYDENGTFALSNAQTLTVTGNSKTAELTVDGKMTLNELASALQNAIAGSNNLGLKNSSVQFKADGDNTTDGGYLQLTSGVIGDEGNFSIAGDQSVIDALGLSVARESENNIVKAKIQDSFGNSRTVTTSSDRLSGLLDGIDVQFESSAAQIAGNGGVVDGLKFGDASSSLKFEVKDAAATAAVTVTVEFDASAAFSMEGLAQHINNAIAGSNAKDYGVEATVVDGQIRLTYNPTNSDSSTDIKVTGANAVLGIEAGTYTGFVDGDKDTDSAIRGMSQIATSTNALKVTIGDGTNAKEISFGTGMKATALTTAGDMKEIENLILSANQQLKTASVSVRLDEVNGSIAFTSTILGTDNENSKEGKVVLSATSGKLDDILGYNEGTAKGSGDTDFRLHVLDNSSQLQIGANQGQTMTFSIGDMSAAALDIDKLDMTTTEGASDAIGKLDNALSKVSAERSKLGAFSNRLEYTMNNLENASTNLTDAESRIRDVDMASEMITYTSAQIMQQAGTAMLAQANSMGQSVLSLLG